MNTIIPIVPSTKDHLTFALALLLLSSCSFSRSSSSLSLISRSVSVSLILASSIRRYIFSFSLWIRIFVPQYVQYAISRFWPISIVPPHSGHFTLIIFIAITVTNFFTVTLVKRDHYITCLTRRSPLSSAFRRSTPHHI